jgi:aminoglycoside phosphotransferase (APT) family kinase protein
VDDPVSVEFEANRRDADVPGIDVPAVTKWLAEHLAEPEPPLHFTRIGEGQSNLTFRVESANGRAIVVRRPPLGTILASAHDMGREYRILTGLATTGARVPRTLAFCGDVEVTGAPFYVMEHVDGVVLTHVDTAEGMPRHALADATRSLVKTLVELQAVDLDAAGLADFRRPESLGSRQLRRWARQWHDSRTRELPVIEEVAERLAAGMPEERESVLVHGDYRLDNAVLAPDGEVRAVLDWELCTVGDPLADVGLMIAYWNELGAAAARPAALFREPVTAVPGFPSAQEVGRLYGELSGRALDELGFWVAFAYWKIAVIVEGVYRRWLNDPTNGSDAGTLQPAVPRLGALARDALDGRLAAG